MSDIKESYDEKKDPTYWINGLIKVIECNAKENRDLRIKVDVLKGELDGMIGNYEQAVQVATEKQKKITKLLRC